MGTAIKSELSKKSKWWINKQRFLELKHFCLQYPVWKKAYSSLDGLSKRPQDLALFKTNSHGDPTTRCAESRIYFSERMAIVENTAIATDAEIANYIIVGVTEGVSYDHLKTKYNIPCCRDVYYNLYRKFFWLLNDARQ